MRIDHRRVLGIGGKNIDSSTCKSIAKRLVGRTSGVAFADTGEDLRGNASVRGSLCVH